MERALIRREAIREISVERIRRVRLPQWNALQYRIQCLERRYAAIRELKVFVDHHRPDEELPSGFHDGSDRIESGQRFPQVIENAQKQHNIERTMRFGREVVDVVHSVGDFLPRIRRAVEKPV